MSFALGQNGFTITEKETPARLALQFQIGKDPNKAPDMVALTTLIGVHQDVMLMRLQQSLPLPVATIHSTSIGPEKELDRIMERETRVVTNLLAQIMVITPEK